jgi:hypothetical protein
LRKKITANDSAVEGEQPPSLLPSLLFFYLDCCFANVLTLFCACDTRSSAPVGRACPTKTLRIAALSYLTAPNRREGLAAALHLTHTMDIILELADTFIFDPLYATLLPAAQSPTGFGGNATFSSRKEEPTGYAVPHATWQYAPSTKSFSLEPSKYAYMSAWSRDDWRRQAVTLYLITWYVLPSPLPFREGTY